MLSLAHAIRKSSGSLAQVQNDYKQNVVAVNTVMTSVLGSSLPSLYQNPPDWQAFVSAFEAANGDALNWVNTVMARLLNVPQEVVGYNSVITQVLQDAKSQSETLIAQPTNQIALATLNQDLVTLTQQLGLVTSFISGAIVALKTSRDTLPDMAAQLQSIAEKSTVDANADQAQIDSLNAKIDQLKADIKSLTAAIIALGITDGVALTLGTVSTIALWPVGALVWFMLGPAIAVASTYIALDAKQIEADQARISDDLAIIQGVTADVATLHVLAHNFSDLAAQSLAIETSLEAVLAEWQTLENDVNAAVTDIRAAIADTRSTNFSAVLNDVSEAISEWNASYAQAGSLQLDLQMNDAVLQYGMTSAQVQVAMAGAKTVDLISYYNQLSQQKKVA